jgi:putative intracellular protease/amidase
MPEQKRIAALLADAFQEEEFFFPKIALNKAGYAVEVVSLGKLPSKSIVISAGPACSTWTARSAMPIPARTRVL